jgi:AraC-like DNA-binding protein
MRPLFPRYSIGHFINEPGNPTQLEVTFFGSMEEPEVDETHKHTFYEVIWIEEGKSRQVIDFKDYNMSRGCLFFISPGQVHRFEEWRSVKGGSVLFSGDFFLMNQRNREQLSELIFLDNVYFQPDLQPDKISFSEILGTIHLIADEKKRPSSSPVILQSYLHILMAQIKRCVESNPSNIVPRPHLLLYKQFQILLETHFPENLIPSEYAGKLNITPHHLNYVIKQVTGKTATEVIRERSILEARRLFTFTDLSVTEIAAQLNYFDSSYFAKIFRSATGTSPSEFRKAISVSYRTK